MMTSYVSQMTNFRLLNEFADDNFKFCGSGRMFPRRLENTVRKGAITRYEQLPLFPQCFQKTHCRHIRTRACLEKD